MNPMLSQRVAELVANGWEPVTTTDTTASLTGRRPFAWWLFLIRFLPRRHHRHPGAVRRQAPERPGALLRELSIPEPVTGGLLFSLLFALLYLASGTVVEFELRARDVLLVYFFTTIGINASARTCWPAGAPS
jgi:hypothetical protein